MVQSDSLSSERLGHSARRDAGEYHWHKHDNDDEFLFCLQREFPVDLEGRTITLGPQQGVVVPKAVLHGTRAPQKCIILMVENVGIVPTGD